MSDEVTALVKRELGAAEVITIPTPKGNEVLREAQERYWPKVKKVVPGPKLEAREDVGAGAGYSGSESIREGTDDVSVVSPLPAPAPPSEEPDNVGQQVVKYLRALDGEAASTNMEPIDFSSLLSSDRPRPVPLITYRNFTEEYIFAYPGEIIRVAGDPGVGKSYFLLELTLAMRTGSPIAGMNARPSRVMWVDEEGSENQLCNRLVFLRATPADLNTENFRYYLNTGIQLDQHASRDRLFKAVSEFQPEVIVIDSAVRISAYDENSASEQAQLYDRGFKPLSRVFGATVFIIDHTNKTGSGDKGIRGSTEKSAQIDRNWLLRKTGKDSFELAPGKTRNSEEPPTMLVRRHVEAGALRHMFDGVA